MEKPLPPVDPGEAAEGAVQHATQAGAQALDAAGERLWLLPERALWWPAGAHLWLADPHLGKAASYRALGQPVPQGTTADNLARLDTLLARWPARHLVVLGDFLHAASARTPAVLAALADWRQRHGALDITLVRGNHDDRAGDPPAALGVRVLDEPHASGPFDGWHHPPDHSPAPGRLHLAGHAHPVCHLQGPGRDRLRLPCFVWRGGCLTLPAFGAFTGGHAVRPDPRTTLYPVGGGRVWAALGGGGAAGPGGGR